MDFLQELLTKALQSKASDVHIVAGLPPLFRIHTILEPAGDYSPMTPSQTEQFVRDMVSPQRFAQLQQHRDIDFSTMVEGLGRFRVNAHYQRDTVAIAFRAITDKVPPLSLLNLPPAIESFVDLPRGLVLVTGQTGSGKSTTLASMIDAMNAKYQHHVITVEDPVEYELRSNKCVIEQRELGSDVPTFASGLRHALRQDPDIILVGEMRDLETTSAAITAAETGHLVLSTLHTQNASQTIERIIDIYPAEQQNQIRAMLSNTLQAVVSMCLFKRIDKPGMVPACEIMICNAAVRNCIRENRIHEIPNIIATSRGMGMCTLDDSIKALYFNGFISRKQAVARAANPDMLNKALSA
ncbi:MAG: Twitching mobility protein [Planctomycetes bacterium ADurb.Bin126]|nr:MAG: Twitching mobility protein [Planctomycetes bacterium ADurb.Bin126]HOD82360.1 PilT/PilU family type 4a pilus ATPase [Phycisphaerae bacterium]HQL73633.1 PilT/PilU family type 4a pilus ATPase [Phycisphaerae bacterium]